MYMATIVTAKGIVYTENSVYGIISVQFIY